MGKKNFFSIPEEDVVFIAAKNMAVFGDSLSVSEISKRLNIPAPRVTRIVNSLKRRGRWFWDTPVSKYRAQRTEYKGVVYASKAEAAYAEYLDSEISKSIDFYVAQPTFRLGCPENVYRADFLVVSLIPSLPKVFVVDVKGMRTRKFARDVKLWKEYGPCELWIVKGGKTQERIFPKKTNIRWVE